MSRGTLIEIANELVDQYSCRNTLVDDVDEKIVDAIRGAVALRAVADDVLARLTAQAERVGTAKRSGMSLRELLCANGLAPAVASRLIRLGRAIQVLPRLARHSRDASISAEHLDAVARGVEHVVRRTGESVDSEAIAALEGSLVGHAVAGTAPAEIVERARAVAIDMTADNPGDGDDADRVPPAEDSTLNELDWRTGDDGRLRGEFELDALSAERLITALDPASRPRPEPDGSDDLRPATRRRADAFAQLLEVGSRGLAPDALSGPPRTEILVTIPVEVDTTTLTAGTASLTWMGPITQLSAKLLSCDARLAGVGLDQRSTGLGHRTRTPVHRGRPQSRPPAGPRLHQMRGTRLLVRRPPHRPPRRRRTHHRRQRLPALPVVPHRGPPRRLGDRDGRRPPPLAHPTRHRRPTTTTAAELQPTNHATRRPHRRLNSRAATQTTRIRAPAPAGPHQLFDNFTV